MAINSWIVDLEDVREEFKKGQLNYPGLTAFMIHVSPKYQSKMNQAPVKRPKGLTVGGNGFYYRIGDGPIPQLCYGRTYWLEGDYSAAYGYKKLAEKAGKALDGQTVKDVKPRSLLDATADNRWYWVLYDIAWKADVNSALHAAQLSWTGKGKKAKVFPLHPNMEEFWYSQISNLYAASVLAIDHILSKRSINASRGGLAGTPNAASIISPPLLVPQATPVSMKSSGSTPADLGIPAKAVAANAVGPVEGQQQQVPNATPHYSNTANDTFDPSSVPALDRGNGQWVCNKLAAELDGLSTGALSKYRSGGEKGDNKFCGRDKWGRTWRKNGTVNSHPWYLKATLVSQQKRRSG